MLSLQAPSTEKKVVGRINRRGNQTFFAFCMYVLLYISLGLWPFCNTSDLLLVSKPKQAKLQFINRSTVWSTKYNAFATKIRVKNYFYTKHGIWALWRVYTKKKGAFVHSYMLIKTFFFSFVFVKSVQDVKYTTNCLMYIFKSHYKFTLYRSREITSKILMFYNYFNPLIKLTCV